MHITASATRKIFDWAAGLWPCARTTAIVLRPLHKEPNTLANSKQASSVLVRAEDDRDIPLMECSLLPHVGAIVIVCRNACRL